MPSTLTGAPVVVGAHYQMTVTHPSGKTYSVRFRNAVLPGFADLPSTQAAHQAAAVALIDAVTPAGPNATAALAALR